MSTWKTVKLSDIGTIVGGATPATSHDEYYNGDIPWLTPKDLAGYAGRYISRGERNISRAGLESCSAKILPKNSILFSSRAPIGYIAIAQNDLVNFHSKCKMLGGVAEFFSEAFLYRGWSIKTKINEGINYF